MSSIALVSWWAPSQKKSCSICIPSQNGQIRLTHSKFLNQLCIRIKRDFKKLQIYKDSCVKLGLNKTFDQPLACLPAINSQPSIILHSCTAHKKSKSLISKKHVTIWTTLMTQLMLNCTASSCQIDNYVYVANIWDQKRNRCEEQELETFAKYHKGKHSDTLIRINKIGTVQT